MDNTSVIGLHVFTCLYIFLKESILDLWSVIDTVWLISVQIKFNLAFGGKVQVFRMTIDTTKSVLQC